MLVAVLEIPARLALQGGEHGVLDLIIVKTLLDILNFTTPISILQSPLLPGVSEHGEHDLALSPSSRVILYSLPGIDGAQGVSGLQPLLETLPGSPCYSSGNEKRHG